MSDQAKFVSRACLSLHPEVNLQEGRRTHTPSATPPPPIPQTLPLHPTALSWNTIQVTGEKSPNVESNNSFSRLQPGNERSSVPSTGDLFPLPSHPTAPLLHLLLLILPLLLLLFLLVPLHPWGAPRQLHPQVQQVEKGNVEAS